jgi:HD-like signal output (HDOD) protein/CheY-like chemotaxis protein
MKGILFVDDEPGVLAGLSGVLRKQRSDWHMAFVPSGAEALRELAAAPYDVIVSDMRMPQMDGAALLRQVQKDYPHVVRIVLSGQTEEEVSRRLVHVAHQFIAKPCEGRELRQTIERTCDLQMLLDRPALREAVGQLGQLPVKPSLYARLVEVLQEPRSSMSDAAAVIEQDVGASAKMLQLVNSAFFGLPQRVGDIRTAVSYLGLELVKTVALSVEMRAAQTELGSCAGFSVDAMQEHSLLAARIARRLMLSERIRGQDAFSAAMLADAGELVLISQQPRLFQEIVAEARRSERPLPAVEREVLGVTHAEIGAYLLGIWGLPYSIVEAVAHHHAPRPSSTTGLDVPTAVHVGGALAAELLSFDRDRHVGAGIELDHAHLVRAGLSSQLIAWREMARSESITPRFA